MHGDDEFRVVSWNLEHNGLGRDGADHHWYLAMDILTGLRPHVVLRQELTRATLNGRRAMWAEAARLGGDGPQFIPFMASATPESPNPTGIYLDPSLCRTTEDHEHTTGIWHPICNPVVRLRGALSKLSLASYHLSSFDPTRRASEAKRLTTLGKPGMAAIIGGDANSYPHRRQAEKAPLPDWNEISDRSHFEHRTIERGGTRICDTQPDQILAGEHHGLPPVFIELGHHAATRLGQPDALLPTASLRRTDQGPPQRIDRIYATPQIAAALTRLETLDTDDVRKVSDHAPVLATFNLTALQHALAPDRTLAA
ncbi:endonuclease/exonuclease/phosphatase family protein [Streptomyces sp. N2-109]|uniref:Endonuclease/exonuclease/phosphatase family protein n=1 Tax=Streptomyces gossypii TaxID=2883101 RepID=A0ABT2JRD8_9ACTN|nr:endonuclease/exonuclease/phosphatase family protein [Streptomyces gossypii]MCT2589809.1 endonuclease/exonuclease/phosphatase family protein [Streptomyces gossypii]